MFTRSRPCDGASALEDTFPQLIFQHVSMGHVCRNAVPFAPSARRALTDKERGPRVRLMTQAPAGQAAALAVAPASQRRLHYLLGHHLGQPPACCQIFPKIAGLCLLRRRRLRKATLRNHHGPTVFQHGRSTPSDASKSERSWRRLSKCLCCEEVFDEMKRTCAYCGMFEDEDDFLVRCQGPDCSLRSADCETPGVFHGRCAAALGHSGGARWQNCPWCPCAKPATMIGVDVPDEEKYFISMTRFGGGELRLPDHPAGMEMDPLARKVTGGQKTPCGAFASGNRRQEKDGDPQGDAIHHEGRGERRSWRAWNLTSASALEEWNGDLWWYDTPSTGLGEVHVFQIARVLRLRMASTIFAGRHATSSSELGVELGIKVNLHTPRCTCEGKVPSDWLWGT